MPLGLPDLGLPPAGRQQQQQVPSAWKKATRRSPQPRLRLQHSQQWPEGLGLCRLLVSWKASAAEANALRPGLPSSRLQSALLAQAEAPASVPSQRPAVLLGPRLLQLQGQLQPGPSHSSSSSLPWAGH